MVMKKATAIHICFVNCWRETAMTRNHLLQNTLALAGRHEYCWQQIHQKMESKT